MATYEPFGISPLEPLCAGAVCVISSVCGCAGFVKEVANGKGAPNVIIADYTELDGEEYTLEELLAIGQAERDPIELRVAVEVADQLMTMIPTSDAERKTMLESGSKLAAKMGWDRVFKHHLEPMLNRVVSSPQSGT
jgi:glycogen synthase